MTRSDYELIASAIAYSQVYGDTLGWLCANLKWDNPKFDKEKFLSYIVKRVSEIERESCGEV